MSGSAKRSFRIVVSRWVARGRFFVVCKECPQSDPWCDWVDSVNDAANAATLHIPDCPAVIAAADQLLDDILHLPTYRLLHMFIPGLGLIPLWGCTDCGRIAADQDEHTARHLDAREREYRHHG